MIRHPRRLALGTSGGHRNLWLGLLALGMTACHPQRPTAAPSSPAEAAVLSPPPIPILSLDPALVRMIQTRREAVTAQPTSGAAWGELGQAFHAAEFQVESIACYREATRRDPQQSRWWHLLAILLLADAPQSALSHLTNALALAPDREASRLRLAKALIERGRDSEATTHLNRLLDVRPDHPAARLELARLQLAQGRPAEAERLLNPCLTNPYTAKPALLLLGQARLRLGDAAAAAQLAQKAVALPKPFDWPDPDLRAVQDLRDDRGRRAELIQELLQNRRLDEADARVQQLLTDAPDDAEGLLLLGRLRLQQRRLPEADAALERHLAVRPDSLNGWVQLGMARYAQTQWLAADAAFSKAIQLKPDFATAHVNRGLALSRAGQRTAALASLREALRIQPTDPGALFALAEELARDGQLQESRELLSRLLARDPSHARANALLQRLPPSPKPSPP